MGYGGGYEDYSGGGYDSSYGGVAGASGMAMVPMMLPNGQVRPFTAPTIALATPHLGAHGIRRWSALMETRAQHNSLYIDIQMGTAKSGHAKLQHHSCNLVFYAL